MLFKRSVFASLATDVRQRREHEWLFSPDPSKNGAHESVLQQQRTTTPSRSPAHACKMTREDARDWRSKQRHLVPGAPMHGRLDMFFPSDIRNDTRRLMSTPAKLSSDETITHLSREKSHAQSLDQMSTLFTGTRAENSIETALSVRISMKMPRVGGRGPAPHGVSPR